MKADPDPVCNTVLSRISLSNWTCGAISEPNAAVAIRHPPLSVSFVFLISIGEFVLGPNQKTKSFLFTVESCPKRYLPSIL